MAIFSATRHSPTHLEPALLASGVSHWELGRFELYRVNPPLPRMIAAIPVLLCGYNSDWADYRIGPGVRAEFNVGDTFLKANSPRSLQLLFLARVISMQFAVIGGYYLFRWGADLYGARPALVSLALWTFDPNVLAHTELMTPDSACWSLGVIAGYYFWSWLRVPSWQTLVLSGVALGTAELCKFTWIILYLLWPLLWLIWRFCIKKPSHFIKEGIQDPATADHRPDSDPHVAPVAKQLVAMILLSLFIVNLGYGFNGLGTPLGECTFVSRAFTGLGITGFPGNRFRQSLFGTLPLPIPSQYILGIDLQQKDFEDFGHPSYLRGEWKADGWWYYYMYGLIVKTPCGTLMLLFLASIARVCSRNSPNSLNELVLVAPAIAVMTVASCQTEFNHHIRYALPSVPFALIFAGSLWNTECVNSRNGLRCVRFVVIMCVIYSGVSSLSHYPHQLSYFNEIGGGSAKGFHHLAGSGVDWGQDLLLLKEQCDRLGIAEQVQIDSSAPFDLVYIDSRFQRVNSLPHYGANIYPRWGSGGRWVAFSKAKFAAPARRGDPVGTEVAFDVGYSLRLVFVRDELER